MANILPRPVAPLVTDEQLVQELAFVHEYDLDRIDTQVRGLLSSIDPTDHSPMQEHLRQRLVERVSAYRRWHEHVPIGIAPNGTIDTGTIRVGMQASAGSVTLLADRVEHTLVVGPTGAGKTSLISPIVEQYDRAGVRVIDLQVKNDRPWLLAHPRVLDFAALAYAPLALPPYGSMTAFLETLVELFLELFWGHELLRGVLAPALETLWARTPNPSLRALQDCLRTIKGDVARRLVDRLEALRLTHPAIFTSTTNIWGDVHDYSLSINVHGILSPATRFLAWQHITERWRHLQDRATTGLHTVVVLDEGDTSFSEAPTPTGTPSIPIQALLRMREAGIAFLVGSPVWHLDPRALANFQNQIFLRPSGRDIPSIQRTLRLSDASASFLARLPLGEAVGLFKRWERPFLFSYAPCDLPKTITSATTKEASERTNAFLTTCAPTPALASTACIPSDTHTLPVVTKETSVILSEQRIAHNATSDAPPSIPQNTPLARRERHIAPNTDRTAHSLLSENDRAFLDFVRRNEPTFMQEIIVAGTHPMQASRSHKRLLALGYVSVDAIIVRPGRGGRAKAISITPSGADAIGKKRDKQGRGQTSAQHRYLATRIARAINAIAPNTATVELSLNGKSVDVLVAYHHDQHRHLSDTLAILAGRDIALNDGDLIAIEIETSDPEHTAPNNITANRGRGVPLTVLAALQPLFVTRLAAADVIVTDALLLLDRLRGAP